MLLHSIEDDIFAQPHNQRAVGQCSYHLVMELPCSVAVHSYCWRHIGRMYCHTETFAQCPKHVSNNGTQYTYPSHTLSSYFSMVYRYFCYTLICKLTQSDKRNNTKKNLTALSGNDLQPLYFITLRFFAKLPSLLSPMFSV